MSCHYLGRVCRRNTNSSFSQGGVGSGCQGGFRLGRRRKPGELFFSITPSAESTSFSPSHSASSPGFFFFSMDGTTGASRIPLKTELRIFTL